MRTVTVLGLLAAFGIANPLEKRGVFEEVPEPAEWKVVGVPADNLVLKFKIALRAADPEALSRHLEDISNPSSRRYGLHFSQDELQAVLKPSDEAKESVQSWLIRSGVKDVEDRGDWLHYSATAEQANAMMGTKFAKYRHVVDSAAETIRTTKVTLPRDVLPHIKMIHPTTRFVQIRQQASGIIRVEEAGDELATTRYVQQGSAAAIPASCGLTITPSCLRELYNITGVEIADPSKVGSIGVAGFLNQLARSSDLKSFTQSQAKWANGATFPVTAVNGGLIDQSSLANSNEANLDIQYTVAISHPMQNRFYSTGGSGPLVTDISQPTLDNNQNEPYIEWFQHLLAEKDLPHTISISYGENEQSVPPSYAKQVCDLIAQLGARGTSVIISSGDTGAGSGCLTNDGKNTTRFLPIFPAACPYATSVGGTSGISPERAVGFSSGGFSDLWPRPKYQDKVVPAFLESLGNKWEGLYNAKGRGFPDIAAQGVDFNVVDKGRIKRISGTSASAPVIAGIVGLLNAQRLQSGQSTLGFLNPWLYETGAQTLTDIVDGRSTGCTGRDTYSGLSSPYIAGASWQAVKGWDPVTGLGTPKFDKMLAALPKDAAPRTPAYFPPAAYGAPRMYRHIRHI